MNTHVYPENDTHEHVTDGSPCPCLAQEDRGVVVHNSYDGREVGEVVLRALDMLRCSLSEHGHTWTDAERRYYERAVALCHMHWPGTTE